MGSHVYFQITTFGKGLMTKLTFVCLLSNMLSCAIFQLSLDSVARRRRSYSRGWIIHCYHQTTTVETNQSIQFLLLCDRITWN